MDRKSKWSKHVHVRTVATVVTAVIDHTARVALDVEVVVDIEEVEEEVEEVAAEPAITAIRLDIWQEIAPKSVESVVEVDSVVEVEVEEVVVVATELATIVTKKDTWPENAPKETAENEIRSLRSRKIGFVR